MSAEKWNVKAVTSGDTLVLFQPIEGKYPPAEKTVILSGIDCPKVARTGGSEVSPDEEFGWQAREYVRKKVIGRMVMFTKESTNETTGKEFGQIMFKEKPTDPPKNLALALVSSGICPMRAGAKGPMAAQLAEAEKTAVMEKRGRYADDARAQGLPRKLLLEPVAPEMLDFIVKKKGEKVSAIVDFVMTGHMLKVLMLDTMQIAMVHMSGITTSNERKLKDKPVELASSKAVEARCHSERFLLNREVTLIIEGKDKYDNILCSVTAGPNVFQEELLKQGFAKVFDPTISDSTFRDRLRTAQGTAQQGRKGQWKDWVPPVFSEKGKEAKEGEQVPILADFTGTVIQCVTGDTLVVKNSATKEKVKITLASVRAGAEKVGEGAPSRVAKIERQVGAGFGYSDGEGLILFHNLFWESREHMRKLLVGKEVKVQVDYMMKFPAQGDAPPDVRPAVTVLYDGENNAAESLIKMGYGIVVGSRDGVSRYMDKLRDCQADAQSEQLGGWSGKQLPTHKVREMARPQAKTGTALLGGLQRASGSQSSAAPKLKCVVEFVLAPNRVKLFVERDRVQVSLNIAGIAVPSMGMGTEDPDPLAPDVLAFAEQRLLQRDVEVSFEAFVGGSFIGNLYLGGKSYAVTLLGEGYATTEGQNQQSMVGKTEATEAEEASKKAKRGIWHPSAGMPKRVQQAQARYSGWEQKSLQVSTKFDKEAATVSEVVDAGTFWFQAVSSERDLRTVDLLLAKAKPKDRPSPAEVKRDDIVCAMFSADKVWYRARVTRVQGRDVWLHFIDYGNKEASSLKNIRKIDEIAASVKTIPAIAQEGHVAFIEAPSIESEYGQEAGMCLRDYAQGDINMAHEYTDPRGGKYYTLSTTGPTFQDEILGRGFAYVKRDLEIIAGLKNRMVDPLKAQEKARRAHTALWRHGDPRDEDAN